MDVVGPLEKAGAHGTMTTTVRHALVEHDGLSGAIMDHALSDGDSTARCARLKERGIPYSGYLAVNGADPAAPHIVEPVPMDTLMSALEELLPSTPRIS
jgi:hypothetical protein